MSYQIQEFKVNDTSAYLTGVDFTLDENRITNQPPSSESIYKYITDESLKSTSYIMNIDAIDSAYKHVATNIRIYNNTYVTSSTLKSNINGYINKIFVFSFYAQKISFGTISNNVFIPRKTIDFKSSNTGLIPNNQVMYNPTYHNTNYKFFNANILEINEYIFKDEYIAFFFDNLEESKLLNLYENRSIYSEINIFNSNDNTFNRYVNINLPVSAIIYNQCNYTEVPQDFIYNNRMNKIIQGNGSTTSNDIKYDDVKNSLVINTSSELKAIKTGIIDKLNFYNLDKNNNIIEIIVCKIIDDVIQNPRWYTFEIDRMGYIELDTMIYINKDEYIGFSFNKSFAFGATGETTLLGTYLLENNYYFYQFYDDASKAVKLPGWVSMSFHLTELAYPTNFRLETIEKQLGTSYGRFIIGTNHIPNIHKNPYNVEYGDEQYLTHSIYDNDVYEGIIRSIGINVIDDDTPMTFAIGFIDQNNYAFIDKSTEFTIICKRGFYNNDCNVYLPKGYRLFIKITSSTKIGCVQNIINTTYITDSNNKLNPTSHAYQFIYTLDGCKYYDSNLISKNDFNTVKNDINILTDKVNNINSNLSSVYLSNNNDVFKLTVDSTGNLSTEKVKSYKIAIFGNSLEKHGLADYWWSTDRGMASSIINKDWCHQLSNMLYQKYYVPCTIEVLNIAEWEVNETKFDYSIMNSVMDNADLVIVRIGENVTSLIDNLQSNTVKLLNYIKNYTDVPILFGGLFWPHDTKTEYMSTAVNSFGDIQYVDFSDLSSDPTNKSYIGAQVIGDDGKWHTINHSGVANHPGDTGFYRMAERFLPYVSELLGITV